MEEINGKCLLDVIGDPSALKEFLRSNSQVALEAQKNDATSMQLSQLAQQNTAQLNHVPALMKSPAGGIEKHTVSTVPGRNVIVTNTPSVVGPNNCVNQTMTGSATVPTSLSSHSPVSAQRTFVASKPSTVNSVKGVAVPAAVMSTRAFVNTTAGNFSKNTGSVVRTTSAPGKQHINSSVSFQAKKPIPIKPKNPSLIPVSSMQSVAGAMLKGLPVLTSSAQGQTRQAASAIVNQGQRNGVDMSSIALANAQTKKVYPGSSQHLTTSAQRIAPKHQAILPQQMHRTPQKISAQSPGNLQKVMVPQMSPGMPLQSQAGLTHISSSAIQQKHEMQPQQYINVVQQPSPHMTSVHQGVTQHITQSPQVLGSQVKHIQQIEQLVQQKLPSLQQSTVVQTTQPQGSTHNLAFQEQVLKQLIIQAQQPSTGLAVQQVQQPTSGSVVQQVQQQQYVKGGMQRQPVKQAVVPQQLQLSRQQQQTAQVQRNTTVQTKVLVPNPSSGSPASSQLQHLVDEQQKQLQLILGQQQQPQQQQQQQKLLIPATQGQQQVYQQVVQDGKLLTSTVQHVTPAQLQQLQQQQQNSGGVQKVIIIKQPEILQKLGVQGGKTQQTIQITPQQLQTLKQLQPQTQTQQGIQKTVVVNKTGTNQPQILTVEQVKQLQQQGVQIKPLQVQNKTLQQRTVLSPQLQKQLQVTAKPQSKMQHIPRILQTSGRQPVTSSKVGHPVIKMNVLPKQDQKGVKRPHPEIAPDVPKVVTRLKQSLVADQQSVLHPDLKRKFTTQEEAVRKLAKYHVYHDPYPNPSDVQKADGLFNLVSTQLVKRSQRMVDKYRHLLIEESMRQEPSSEMVMLYRVFLADERALLADERKMAKEKPSEFVAKLRGRDQCPSDAAKTSPESESSQNLHVARPSDSVSSCSSTKDHTVKNSRTSLLVNQSTSRSSSVTGDKVCSPIKGKACERPVPSHPSSKQTFNNVVSSNLSLEDKTSSVSKLSSHVSCGTAAADCVPEQRDPLMSDTATVEDSSEEIRVEADSEKEDITATLALLNSMASELDVLDL